MRAKPICRLHGGKGGGPKGERNGAYRTEAKAERRQVRMLIGACGLIESGEGPGCIGQNLRWDTGTL